MVKRAAFTFIELIFAIVIIAISVISLPMMNQVISKGIENNLVQEAIFAAATELNEAVTSHWDDNSIDPTSPSSFARVIDHAGNCDNNTLHSTYRRMPGHIHRLCLRSSITLPANSNVNNNIDSLDDIEHPALNIFIDATKDTSGYKKSYTSEVAVDINASFGGAPNLDIKSITIKIRNSDGDIITSLKTYSANIGEVDYLKKEY